MPHIIIEAATALTIGTLFFGWIYFLVKDML